MCGFIQVKRTLGPPASLPCPRPTSSFTALPRLSRWRRRFVLDVTPDLDATVALGGCQLHVAPLPCGGEAARADPASHGSAPLRAAPSRGLTGARVALDHGYGAALESDSGGAKI